MFRRPAVATAMAVLALALAACSDSGVRSASSIPSPPALPTGLPDDSTASSPASATPADLPLPAGCSIVTKTEVAAAFHVPSVSQEETKEDGPVSFANCIYTTNSFGLSVSGSDTDNADGMTADQWMKNELAGCPTKAAVSGVWDVAFYCATPSPTLVAVSVVGSHVRELHLSGQSISGGRQWQQILTSLAETGFTRLI